MCPARFDFYKTPWDELHASICGIKMTIATIVSYVLFVVGCVLQPKRHLLSNTVTLVCDKTINLIVHLTWT